MDYNSGYKGAEVEALLNKLETLKNYDDSELVSRIDTIQQTIDTLFSKDASSAIESFNEIIAFREGIQDSENLDSIIASIEQQIADVQSSIPAQLDILKAVYPVGAIYISTASTSPKTLFGFGTWTRIKDTFLLSAGDTYSAGDTGGEAEHTLTTDEMPSHKHTVTAAEAGEHTHTIGNDQDVAYNSSGKCRSVHKAATGASYYDGSTGENGAHTHTMTVKNTGGGSAHNNMPPYLAVYMWQRTE